MVAAAGPNVAIVCDRVGSPLELCRTVSRAPARRSSYPTKPISASGWRPPGPESRAVIRRPVSVTELSECAQLSGEPRSTRGSLGPARRRRLARVGDQRRPCSSRPGMTVTTVNDPPAKAVAAIEELAPDIVLMDMQMPAIGGLELGSGDPPVHAFHLAADHLPFGRARWGNDKLAARRQGGDDFITKPVEPRDPRVTGAVACGSVETPAVLPSSATG